MKRLLALLGAAMVLAGCRSSSQPSDPFLRTTVPPPGTATGPDFSPGGPAGPQVYPGSAAPAPTGPAAPPQDNRYAPPGGNFQQGSYRSKAVAPTGSEYRISPTALARRSNGVNPNASPTGASQTEAIAADRNARGDGTPTQFAAQPQSGPSHSIDSGLRRTSQIVGGEQGSSTLRIVGTADPQSPTAQQGLAATRPIAEPARFQLAASQPLTEITELPQGGFRDVRQVAYTPGRVIAGNPTSPRGFISQATYQAPIAAPRSNPNARYDHSPDYQNLRGRLEFSQSRSQWKLRYIPIDGQTDSYGGSVVLGASPVLQNFKPGDYVEARGRIAGQMPSTRDIAPQYELATLQSLAN